MSDSHSRTDSNSYGPLNVTHDERMKGYCNRSSVSEVSPRCKYISQLLHIYTDRQLQVKMYSYNHVRHTTGMYSPPTFSGVAGENGYVRKHVTVHFFSNTYKACQTKTKTQAGLETIYQKQGCRKDTMHVLGISLCKGESI